MSNPDRTRVVHFAEARAAIPGPAGERATTLFQRGTLEVKLSAQPLRPNPRATHAQDEIYVIVEGRGVLVHDGRREPFEAGDCIFVAAGTEHHFEDFSDSLAAWVIFHGPAGGELPG
jgi:mannose-6-phosphate isomerase-like protein (cupin superfamily)